MITTISSINICHHAQLQKFSSCGLRVFKIHFFQICNMALTTATTLYITTQWLIHFITGKLYLLTLFIPTDDPLHLRQPPICSLYPWALILSFNTNILSTKRAHVIQTVTGSFYNAHSLQSHICCYLTQSNSVYIHTWIICTHVYTHIYIPHLVYLIIKKTSLF